MFQLLCAVFIGGGTGSVLRWWLGMKLNPVHHAIPIGTLTANLLGAFVIGAGLAWFNRLTGIDPMWKLLITTGFCGGLTTFSTFCTVSDFELYALTFSQSFETVGLDCREVYEYIFAAIFRSNETESFGLIKPLNVTFNLRHQNYLYMKNRH